MTVPLVTVGQQYSHLVFDGCLVLLLVLLEFLGHFNSFPY